MRFVEYIHDGLCALDSVIQFSFSTQEELETHPHIKRISNMRDFRQFALDGVWMVALFKPKETTPIPTAIIIGIIMGEDRSNLEYSTLDNSGDQSKRIVSYRKAPLSMTAAVTGREYASPDEVVVKDWVFYLTDGRVVKGRGATSELAWSTADKHPLDKIDFVRDGKDIDYVWVSSDRDWVLKTNYR